MMYATGRGRGAAVAAAAMVLVAGCARFAGPVRHGSLRRDDVGGHADPPGRAGLASQVEPRRVVRAAPGQPTRGDQLRRVAVADGRPPPRLEVDHWDTDGERHDGLFAGGRAISLDEFLHLTGHTDVIDRMRTRRRLRIGLAAVGVGTIAGAVLAMNLGPSCDGVADDPRTPAHEPAACLDRRNFRGSVTGAIGMAGAGLIVGAYAMSPLAPGRDELRRAASRYNDQHGVTGAAPVSDLELAPAVSPDAATLTVSGRF